MWISGREGSAEENLPGSTVVKVLHVFKKHDDERSIGDEITLERFHVGRTGELFFLIGYLREGEVIRWDPLRSVNTTELGEREKEVLQSNSPLLTIALGIGLGEAEKKDD